MSKLRKPSLGTISLAILLLVLLALSSTACGGDREEAPLGKITFASDRDGNREIYIVDADGSGMTRLTNNPSRENGNPVSSPDGKRIAFESRRGNTTDIFIMYTDGTEQTNLTKLEEWGWARFPTWSPDGKRIAFVEDAQIMILSLDDRSEAALAPGLQELFTPKWSPDGEGVAFIAQEEVVNGEPNFGLYVINVDGTGLKRLSGDARQNSHPVWSPYGDSIALTCVVDGNADIYVVNADGTGLVRLTDDSSWDYTPSWSPDGTKIAFGSGREGCGEIFVMDADGSQQTNLTRTPDACSDYPRWSPDGKMIAFKSGRDGNSEIYVMNYDGSDQTNITNHPASEPWLAWSP